MKKIERSTKGSKRGNIAICDSVNTNIALRDALYHFEPCRNMRGGPTTRDFLREEGVANKLKFLLEEGVPGLKTPERFLESMSHCAQVSEEFYKKQLEFHDGYARFEELRIPVIRELIHLAEAQSALVREGFKFERSEWKNAAYEVVGEKLQIQQDTLPVPDMQKIRPSLPDEVQVLLSQLLDYQSNASLFQEFLHFMTNPAGVPPLL